MTDGIVWEEPPPSPINPDPDAVRRWVAASCADQGIPFHVSDPAALAKIGVLFTGARAPGR